MLSADSATRRANRSLSSLARIKKTKRRTIDRMRQTLRDVIREAGDAFSSVFGNPNLRRVEVSWAGTVCAYWIFIVTLLATLMATTTRSRR